MKDIDMRGYRVMGSAALVKERTWRERLFTKPWRPWVSTKPDLEAAVVDAQNGVIYVHPIRAPQVRRFVESAREAS